MKKIIILLLFFISSVLISESSGLTQNSMQIEKIRILQEDIPSGYMYGLLPEFAKKVLKTNPCYMEKDAIKTLTEKIYPDGDYNNIEAIHMTIIARNETPHGDDIVCYIIQYKNPIAAKEEITKIGEYIKFNSDRAILNIKDNLAVFIHVDDKDDFHYILEMDKKIKDRINSL